MLRKIHSLCQQKNENLEKNSGIIIKFSISNQQRNEEPANAIVDQLLRNGKVRDF